MKFLSKKYPEVVEMKIANIFPIANQELYKQEKITMILAHLVQKGLYDPKNFSKDQFIIMDNGLFEKAQISTDIADCIELAEKSGIPVTEIVVPDVINDLKETIRLFEKNLPTMGRWAGKYHFMFVAQATTYGQLHKAIKYINNYANCGIKITVGISKLTPLNRADQKAIRCYRECLHPIHFLGVKDSFEELVPCASLLRSCDTSQLAYIDKNFLKAPCTTLLPYKRSNVLEGKEIDLEKDVCSSERLSLLRKVLHEEGARHGLL